MGMDNLECINMEYYGSMTHYGKCSKYRVAENKQKTRQAIYDFRHDSVQSKLRD